MDVCLVPDMLVDDVTALDGEIDFDDIEFLTDEDVSEPVHYIKNEVLAPVSVNPSFRPSPSPSLTSCDEDLDDAVAVVANYDEGDDDDEDEYDVEVEEEGLETKPEAEAKVDFTAEDKEDEIVPFGTLLIEVGLLTSKDEQTRFTCTELGCGKFFRSLHALSGHQRMHKTNTGVKRCYDDMVKCGDGEVPDGVEWGPGDDCVHTCTSECKCPVIKVSRFIKLLGV